MEQNITRKKSLKKGMEKRGKIKMDKNKRDNANSKCNKGGEKI